MDPSPHTSQDVAQLLKGSSVKNWSRFEKQTHLSLAGLFPTLLTGKTSTSMAPVIDHPPRTSPEARRISPESPEHAVAISISARTSRSPRTLRSGGLGTWHIAYMVNRQLVALTLCHAANRLGIYLSCAYTTLA